MATDQEESADLLYAMRAVMVLLGSGIGIESALQMIGRGGYGLTRLLGQINFEAIAPKLIRHKLQAIFSHAAKDPRVQFKWRQPVRRAAVHRRW